MRNSNGETYLFLSYSTQVYSFSYQFWHFSRMNDPVIKPFKKRMKEMTRNRKSNYEQFDGFSFCIMINLSRRHSPSVANRIFSRHLYNQFAFNPIICAYIMFSKWKGKNLLRIKLDLPDIIDPIICYKNFLAILSH